MPVSTTAADGGVMQYGYDSTGTFATNTTLPTSANGVTLATSASFDSASGASLSATGPNSGQTTTVTQYDALLRPASISLPNSGKVTQTYLTPNNPYFTWTLSSNQTGDESVLYDGYGRQIRTALNNGQSSNPWYQQDQCYDQAGMLQFVSTRYQGGGFGTAARCSGSGASYTYDALGRVTSVKTDDGTATMQYTGRAVLSTDVNGVKRITQYDLLGRIAGICEISNSTLSSGAPTSCTYNLNGTSVAMDISGTGFVTTYTYDLANHKVTIQQGAQTRTFVTDLAGRTTMVQEPERGQTTYSYSYNARGLQVKRTRPKANQTSTTAFTNTTTQYDTLQRVIGISYDDGLTPAKNFLYDVAGQFGWSQAPTNPLGNLVSASTVTPGGATNTIMQMGYDSVGELTTVWECAPSICGTGNQQSRGAEQSSYDLAGDLVSSFDGASGSISYGRSPAGELTSMTQNSYTNSANAPNLVSNVVNGPFGPINWTLGNGLQGVKSYDSLGRYSGNWICQGQNTSSTMYCPNGDTQLYGSSSNFSGSRSTGVCDSAMNQCQGMGYDEFNRLNVVSNNNSKYTYSYDIYGNRLNQTSSPSGPAPNHTYDPTTNRINDGTVSYDTAGNLMGDGSHSYTYDAEGNVVSVDNGSTANYVYDSLNRRVSSQTSAGTTEYVYNAQGQRTSSWLVNGSASGSGNEGRIYWDGQQFGYRAFDGTTYFQHKSVLGTDRLRTNYQGQVVTTETSLAFGDAFSQTNSNPNGPTQDNDQYAGLEHDAESFSEHATFRQYSSTQGRWMSPDPYDGSYDPTNPQSFNRYSYVLNNPFGYTDPTGLDDCDDNCDGSDPGSPGLLLDTGGGGNGGGGDGGGGGGGGVEANSGSDSGFAAAGTVTPCGTAFCLTVTTQSQNNDNYFDPFVAWFLQLFSFSPHAVAPDNGAVDPSVSQAATKYSGCALVAAGAGLKSFFGLPLSMQAGPPGPSTVLRAGRQAFAGAAPLLPTAAFEIGGLTAAKFAADAIPIVGEVLLAAQTGLAVYDAGKTLVNCVTH